LIRRADVAIGVVGVALFCCGVSWAYLLGRTLEIGPSFPAIGWGVVTLAVAGSPFALVLLVCAYIRGHRSPVRLASGLVIPFLVSVMISEVYVSTQDLMLRNRIVEDQTWENRWFPFEHRDIYYLETTGWTVVD
jgi:amino acid permease